eukprot:CAMPEP_0114556718 /NCGR_PEP_ID=MMETSP0114-20121206/9437_1 /TAXON_ID=31324 /ORGANISM="Goniomonas sp, Strain m" /LENGTH=311 /DNA_ID=CAMNT_0001741939 /DNA_START=84 /DNA_END=1015 /DNA_ORIENTATION=+
MAAKTVVVGIAGASAGAAALQNEDFRRVWEGVKDSVGMTTREWRGPEAELLARVDMLSKQLVDLRSVAVNRESSVTVLSGNQSRFSGSSMLWCAGLVACGAAYMKWKGYSIDNVFYVTKATLVETTQALQSRVALLSAALDDARNQLHLKMGDVQGSLQGDITQMQGTLENEIAQARSDVRNVHAEVGGVRQHLENISGQFEGADKRLHYTTQGIQLLCSVVSENLGGTNTPAVTELREFARTAPAQIANYRPLAIQNRRTSSGLEFLASTVPSSNNQSLEVKSLASTHPQVSRVSSRVSAPLDHRVLTDR